MKIRQKLQSNRGETLAETLAAILVIGIVSGAMAAGISAASRMNRKAATKDADLYAAVTAAEEQLSGTELPGTLTVSIGDTDSELPISLYGAAHIYSYRAAAQEMNHDEE